jgi:outer membrane protein OmpA-like peptidoglycan-associated protein
MKTALITLAFIAASLSLISAATPDLSGPEQTATEAGRQAEHLTAYPQAAQQPPPLRPSSSPAPRFPSQLEQLRAALDSNREELQWVQELLQQAGETLYWAQTRQQQSLVTQRALEDQLTAVAAAYEARQAQVTLLAGELKAVKASLSTNNWQDSDSQARIQALEDDREQLRHALADRDQQLAMMEKELQAARTELQQAKVETVATNKQVSSSTHDQDQTCRTQHAALDDKLTGLRRSETDARQSLVKANAARYELQTELAACSKNLIQAKASFASMEAAAGPPPSTPASSDAVPEAEPAPAVTVDNLKDGDGDSPSDSPLSLQGVKFRYDSSELTEESRAILDQVATVLRKQAHARHEVAGHTDSQGDPAYNQWLSQRRANTVRKYLISRGVDARKLKARGYGGIQPIADNSTWAGLVSNRRVELRGIH